MVQCGEFVMFYFNGKLVFGYMGEIIVVVLYVGGQWIFSCSFKYYWFCSLFCLVGYCFNCLMWVDGMFNVCICIILVQVGLRVVF